MIHYYQRSRERRGGGAERPRTWLLKSGLLWPCHHTKQQFFFRPLNEIDILTNECTRI